VQVEDVCGGKALEAALARTSHLPLPASVIDPAEVRKYGMVDYDDYSDSVYVDCPYDDYQDN